MGQAETVDGWLKVLQPMMIYQIRYRFNENKYGFRGKDMDRKTYKGSHSLARLIKTPGLQKSHWMRKYVPGMGEVARPAPDEITGLCMDGSLVSERYPGYR